MNARTHGSRSLAVPLLLVAVLVALTALAYASPPDPTYIGGFWDDRDYDDVVILATSANSITHVQAAYDLALVCVVIAALSTGESRLLSSTATVRPSRAPPTA